MPLLLALGAALDLAVELSVERGGTFAVGVFTRSGTTKRAKTKFARSGLSRGDADLHLVDVFAELE